MNTAVTDYEYKLISRCLGSVDFEDIVLIYKDHEIEKSEEEIKHACDYVRAKEEERKYKLKENRINNNLQEYRATVLFNGAKQRANKKNIPFDLTLSWVKEKLETGVCEVTKLKFVLTKYNEGSSKTNPYAPSIDQIKPSAGYTKDNCRMVINSYNKFKSDYSDEEVLKIAKAVVNSATKQSVPNQPSK